MSSERKPKDEPQARRRRLDQLVRWVESDLITERRWNLVRSNGTSAATVFDNGVWFTWDEDGIGGENSKEASVELAKAEAVLSALNQGFLTSNPVVRGATESRTSPPRCSNS